jgi:hypothetical protein
MFRCLPLLELGDVDEIAPADDAGPPGSRFGFPEASSAVTIIAEPSDAKGGGVGQRCHQRALQDLHRYEV